MIILIKIYWAIGAVSIAIYLALHYAEVAPLLRKNDSSGMLTWILNLTHDKDLEKYKYICIKESKSLFWYNLLKQMNKYTIVYLIGWIIIILL